MNNSETILVVEDDSSTRIILTTLLEEEGFQVKPFPTAEEALNQIAGQEPVDIVISDLKLPDGSGLKILWAMKKLKPAAAFILITGYASVETAIEAVNEGAFAYHVKPLDIDALRSSVRNAIRQNDSSQKTGAFWTGCGDITRSWRRRTRSWSRLPWPRARSWQRYPTSSRRL